MAFCKLKSIIFGKLSNSPLAKKNSDIIYKNAQTYLRFVKKERNTNVIFK